MGLRSGAEQGRGVAERTRRALDGKEGRPCGRDERPERSEESEVGRRADTASRVRRAKRSGAVGINRLEARAERQRAPENTREEQPSGVSRGGGNEPNERPERAKTDRRRKSGAQRSAGRRSKGRKARETAL